MTRIAPRSPSPRPKPGSGGSRGRGARGARAPPFQKNNKKLGPIAEYWAIFVQFCS